VAKSLSGGVGALRVSGVRSWGRQHTPQQLVPTGGEEAAAGRRAGRLEERHPFVSEAVSILPAEFRQLALGCRC